MQVILLIGFILIFSLDETHGSSICYKSRICIHTNKEKCGKNRDGEVRRFLDSCDMKEFNCLENTNYVPTNYKECEDLPELDAPESQPENTKANEPEEPDENTETEYNKPDEYRSKTEKQDEGSLGDPNLADARLLTPLSHGLVNGPEEYEGVTEDNVETERISGDDVEVALYEVKKLSNRLVKTPNNEGYKYDRNENFEKNNKKENRKVMSDEESGIENTENFSINRFS